MSIKSGSHLWFHPLHYDQWRCPLRGVFFLFYFNKFPLLRLITGKTAQDVKSGTSFVWFLSFFFLIVIMPPQEFREIFLVFFFCFFFLFRSISRQESERNTLCSFVALLFCFTFEYFIIISMYLVKWKLAALLARNAGDKKVALRLGNDNNPKSDDLLTTLVDRCGWFFLFFLLFFLFFCCCGVRVGLIPGYLPRQASRIDRLTDWTVTIDPATSMAMIGIGG